MTKSTSQQLISIIVPVYNEVANLPLLHTALCEVVDKLPQNYQFIFVDDGSTDKSASVMHQLAQQDDRVQVIEFSRNFGKEIATTAGLHAATGDAAIMLDADLQHPVELIPDFIAKWQNGAEVVVGIRKSSERETWQKRLNSWLFYKLINMIAEIKITPRATDYRLLDRVVIDQFNQMSERNRMTRGLIDWLGFRREYIYFKSNQRLHGAANYSVSKLIQLASHSFISLSLFPLRIAGWLGIIITSFAASFGIFVLIEQAILNDPLGLRITGTALVGDINMLLIGIVLMALGLISLYIANIHTEVINRPLYVVRPPTKVKPNNHT